MAQKPALPWWTWVLPLVIFHFGTGLSLGFQISPGMALWYLPVPLGMLLIQWWGPRVLVGLYLNALLCAGYWGLFRWWLWPLYALPETLKVALSWWLFTRTIKGKPWLPGLPDTWKFLLFGVIVPCGIATFFGQSLLVLLGDLGKDHLLRNICVEFVLDILSPFAITVPVLLFATSWMEKHGFSLTRGAYPRPPLILSGRFKRGMFYEAAALFAAMPMLSLYVSLEKYWFVYGVFLLWTAIRFGIGMAALATVWTIFLTLPLHAMIVGRFAASVMTQSDLLKINLNLATLCFASLVVGRALSDVFQEIDARAKVEGSLRESIAEWEVLQTTVREGEDKYRLLFEAANDAIMLGDNGIIIECNERALEMFRMAKADLVGSHASRLYAMNLEEGSAPEAEIARFRGAAMDGRTQFFEWKMRRMGGDLFDAELTFVGVTLEGRRAVMGVIRDITKRKAMEKAITENETRYRALFESANDAILLTEKGRVVDCNQRTGELFGFSHADLIGNSVSIGFPEFQADGSRSEEKIKGIREAALAGIPQNYEWRQRRSDGTTFDSEVNLSRVTIEDRRMLQVVIRDITKRKVMEQAILENETRYRTLFETANDAIVLSENGVILDCNQRCAEIFKYAREELIGFPTLKCFSEFQPDGIRSEVKILGVRQAAMDGKPQSVEWNHQRSDGSTFESEATLNLVTIGERRMLQVVIRDVSERKRIERALIESEERFRQMAENIQEIFFLLDRATQRMLYLSPLAKTVLGIPVSSLANRPFTFAERVHPEDRERIGFFAEGGWYRESFNEDFRYDRPDGQLRWLRLRSFLIHDAQGEVFRVAGVIADITDYKSAQEEARGHQQRLIQADKMNSLGLMVSGVAHEINNPNNLIMLNGDVMETFWRHMRPVLREHASQNPDWKLAGIPYGNAEGKFETLLGGVSGGAKRIKRIVDNLKDFARMDGGDLSESVSLEKVVEASVGIVDNLIRKSTDHFIVSHADKVPRIRGNFQKLEQVIINLITNACQALDSRSKAIRIFTWHEKESGLVGIRVEDEGRGIPTGLLNKVADPFFTTKRDTGGTGLGLSVTYGIIREHRGVIEFNSEEGRGTTVEIRIPALKES